MTAPERSCTTSSSRRAAAPARGTAVVEPGCGTVIYARARGAVRPAARPAARARRAAGRPRRHLPAQVDRRGCGDLRHPQGRARPTCRSIPARRRRATPTSCTTARCKAVVLESALRGEAARRARGAGRRAAALCCSRPAGGGSAPARGRSTRSTRRRQAPPVATVCTAADRPRLHPLHLRLDRASRRA